MVDLDILRQDAVLVALGEDARELDQAFELVAVLDDESHPLDSLLINSGIVVIVVLKLFR